MFEIKKLDRVKRVPKKATLYFKDFLNNMRIILKANGVDTACDILVVDVEREFVHFNIEAWDTFKLSLRMKDMMPVLEFKNLYDLNMGWEQTALVTKIFHNLKTWDDYIKLNASIDKTKQFIFNRTMIVEHESNAPRQGGVYLVEFEDGPKPQCMMGPWLQKSKQEWYGYSHEDALRNAFVYQSDRKPIKVTFLRTEKF